eukprot:6202879-Pleurochrysis_carterae.AAC.1
MAPPLALGGARALRAEPDRGDDAKGQAEAEAGRQQCVEKDRLLTLLGARRRARNARKRR